MSRPSKGSPRNATKRLSLLLALILLLLPATRAATAARHEGEGDAPPSREEQYDTLLESLERFFFGAQTPAAAQTPTPTPTPAAPQAGAGEERAAPPAPPTGKAVTPRALKYRLRRHF